MAHKEVDGTHSEYFANWDSSLISIPPAREKVNIQLILKSAKPLNELVIPRHYSLKHRHKLFAEYIGASEDQLRRIRHFAREYNLRIVAEDKDMGIIDISGTVAAMNKAFNV